jgi:hypothetical protein
MNYLFYLIRKIALGIITIACLASCAAPYQTERLGYDKSRLEASNEACYVLILDEETLGEKPADTSMLGKFIVRSKYDECFFEDAEPMIKEEACALRANVALVQLEDDTDNCYFSVSFFDVKPKNLDLSTMVALEREFTSTAGGNRPKAKGGGGSSAGNVVLGAVMGVLGFLLAAALFGG